MKEFYAMYGKTRIALLEHFSDNKIDRLQQKSEVQYQAFFSDLPYIGGSKNQDTLNLIMGAIVLSIIIPLRKEGLNKSQIGKVIYDTFDGYFLARPAIIRQLLGWLVTTDLYIWHIKRQIARSMRKEYDDDFAMEHVETEGEIFDFGYNYTNCALKKFFLQHNMSEYLRYVCLGDYALFQSLGICFRRTQTIANGAALCDFQFKKKGKKISGWPPENLPEWTSGQ